MKLIYVNTAMENAIIKDSIIYNRAYELAINPNNLDVAIDILHIEEDLILMVMELAVEKIKKDVNSFYKSMMSPSVIHRPIDTDLGRVLSHTDILNKVINEVSLGMRSKIKDSMTSQHTICKLKAMSDIVSAVQIIEQKEYNDG